MVFVNKAVLNSSPNLPLLSQFLTAIICLYLSAMLSPRIEIPHKMLSADKLKRLLPIIMTNVIGLTFNTLCLRGVNASFFQIARGLVLPLTIVVSSVDKKASPTIPVLIAGTVVTIGFFVGIVPKSTSSRTEAPAMSLIWGVLSSLMTAVHAVLIKRSLSFVDNSAIQLAYWTNASAALILLPFVLFNGEVSTVWSRMTFVEPLGSAVGSASAGEVTEAWDWHTFVAGCLITGVVGFLLCVAGVLSIKVTSPITHMFSSACRSVLQTVLGVWIFDDLLTFNRITSILTILKGSMYYTWIKSQEADQKATTMDNNKHGRHWREEQELEGDLLMQDRDYEQGSDWIILFEVTDMSDDEDEAKARECT
ncbi:hypothetical protein FRB95_013159 [Tulasnella sp. JGI-2019a]|nr:hypothetical protein FRB95_013159 [Tulasnella sp. JGI-2019a]